MPLPSFESRMICIRITPTPALACALVCRKHSAIALYAPIQNAPETSSATHAETKIQSYSSTVWTPGVHWDDPAGEIVPLGQGVGRVVPCVQ